MESRDEDQSGDKGRTSKLPSDSNVSETDQNVSPQRKYKNIFLQVCLTILCTEFCERLAFYGLTGSLAIFYTKACVKCILIAPHVRSLLLVFDCPVRKLNIRLHFTRSTYAQTGVSDFDRGVDGTHFFIFLCNLFDPNSGCIRRR